MSSISLLISIRSENAFFVSSIRVVESESFICCGRYPIVISFGLDTLPDEGVCRPARILRSVDLPAPFLPTNAILSVLLITKLISVKRGRAENSTLRLFIDIIAI